MVCRYHITKKIRVLFSLSILVLLSPVPSLGFYCQWFPCVCALSFSQLHPYKLNGTENLAYYWLPNETGPSDLRRLNTRSQPVPITTMHYTSLYAFFLISKSMGHVHCLYFNSWSTRNPIISVKNFYAEICSLCKKPSLTEKSNLILTSFSSSTLNTTYYSITYKQETQFIKTTI